MQGKDVFFGQGTFAIPILSVIVVKCHTAAEGFKTVLTPLPPGNSLAIEIVLWVDRGEHIHQLSCRNQPRLRFLHCEYLRGYVKKFAPNKGLLSRHLHMIT